jgi:serine/threonine protein phosphatase PrpC
VHRLLNSSMGCAPSKEEFLKDKKLGELELEELTAGLATFLPTGGPLTAKDYKERLVSSGGTQTYDLPHSGYTVRYAYVSQRGFYPDAPDKANQDAFCVQTCFASDAEQLLFGVFDGHGEHGHTCSQFAKDKVCIHTGGMCACARTLASTWYCMQVTENLKHNSHFAVSPEIAYHQAMVTANNQLHRSDVDDSMSGTTAIALLIRGKSVYVANVGDSHAVLAERQGDRLIAHDLSFDQTPFRYGHLCRIHR